MACIRCRRLGITCDHRQIPDEPQQVVKRPLTLMQLPQTPERREEDAKIGRLSLSAIKLCADHFTHHMYARIPVVDAQTIDAAIGKARTGSSKTAALLLQAMCAFTIVQPNDDSDTWDQLRLHGDERLAFGCSLLEDVCRKRVTLQNLDLESPGSPPIWSVMTSILIAESHWTLRDSEGAWNALREASSNAYSLGLFDRDVHSGQALILHLMLFNKERLYALKLLPIKRKLPLTVSPPVLNGDWKFPPHDISMKKLISTYLLVSHVGCHVLQGAPLEGVDMRWQYLELTTAMHLSWRDDEAQTLEMRCTQYWLQASIMARPIAAAGSTATAEWRDIVIATLQDTAHLVLVARGFGLSGSLDQNFLCDIACFGLAALSLLGTGWPGSSTQALRYIEQIVTSIGDTIKQCRIVSPSLTEQLCHAQCQITSVAVTRQAVVSCTPAHIALNNKLQISNSEQVSVGQREKNVTWLENGARS